MKNKHKDSHNKENNLASMPLEYIGMFYNGGHPDACDMLQGPCACGAWHHQEEWPEWLQLEVFGGYIKYDGPLSYPRKSIAEKVEERIKMYQKHHKPTGLHAPDYVAGEEHKRRQEMSKWLDYPEEDGWYFLRWNWWGSGAACECVYVYTNEDEDTGERFVSRLNMPNMVINNLTHGHRWIKIKLPDIKEQKLCEK